MVDLYCERIGPDLWAEPINTATNIAFILAAWAVWLLAHRLQALSTNIWVLIGMMAAVGVGSSIFHTFATSWARVLDVLPILLFQSLYLWLYSGRIANISHWYASGLSVGFLAAVLLTLQFPKTLNGSLMYAPAFFLLLGFGIYHYRQRKCEKGLLLIASGLFLLSLFFRTIDSYACSYSSIGTHYIWHILNAVIMYLVARGLLVNLPKPEKTG